MKNLRMLLALVGLVALVAVMPVAAQGPESTFNGANLEVKFSVPMAFYAGDKLMPAGAYEVTMGAGVQANMLLLRGKGKNETYLEFTPVNSNKPLAKMDVTFNKYGDKEYLSAIKYPGSDPNMGSWVLKINPSAGEQAAAKAAAAAAHSVPASTTKK